MEQRSFKLLGIFTGIFVGVLVLVPSMSSKFIAIGPLTIVGSTLIFPITFIFNDIFTEVYGYKRSRRIIWTGMAMQIFAALFYWLIDIWPSATFWSNQECYSSILGQTPRIVIASLTAYFVGEFANSVVLSRMKHRQKGKKGIKQGWRFVLSTIVGEGLDSVVFMTVAFVGVLSGSDLGITILTIWAAKTAYEILVLPVSLRFSNWVKRVEGVDQIDDPKEVNYNPFKLR